MNEEAQKDLTSDRGNDSWFTFKAEIFTTFCYKQAYSGPFQRGTRSPKPDMLQDYDFHIGKAGLIRQSRGRGVVSSDLFILDL
jgi:hypothetical protein